MSGFDADMELPMSDRTPARGRQASPRRKKFLRVPIALLLLVLGAIVGWVGARRAAALSMATPSSMETATVVRRDLTATVLATGVVRPKVGAQVAVGSRVSGILRRLHVTVGDHVSAGQLLAELDRVEFETQVARAEAALMSAAAERTYAETEFARAQRLAESGVLTAVELSAAQRQHATALAREREAQAALAAARVQLGYTTIHAPIAGVVGNVSTQEGETVAASFASPTFLTILDLSRLEVWAYVDETDIGRVAPRQRVRFTVDTYPGTEFDGRVTAIRPAAEVINNVVNYIAIIEFEDQADRILRPEMTTTVNIALDGRENALSVPNNALRRDSEGTYVLVATAAGTERRAVEAGFRGAEFTEILDGLDSGDSVAFGTMQPCESGSITVRDR